MAHILVVDDDQFLRLLIQRALETAGHTVLSCENGKKAVEHIEHADTDLLITDILMPEMDGVTAMRKLRALPSPPKIVAMSGGVQLSREDFPRAAELMGADAALNKPFRARELYALIDRLLGPSSARSA